MRVFLFGLFLVPLTLYTDKPLPYNVGENLFFNIYFGGLKVGKASIHNVKKVEIDSTPTYHIVAKGQTSRFFDLFFKVRDVYETYLDIKRVLPLRFLRDIYEGGYEKKQVYRFKHADSLVLVKDTSYSIFSNSQDMLSALFYARNLSKDSLRQEGLLTIPIFMDEENFFLEILYLKNEMVKTDFGLVNCMVFKPRMQKGRVFRDGEKMKVWISDDKNRLPIKIETEIWAGTIRALLVNYKELKNPMSIIKQN